MSANLHGCDFQMAILDEAVFLNVHLYKSTNLRGASLVNLYNKDQRDISGSLVQPGTDWRLATHDASTTYRKDPAAQALELLEEVGNLLTGDNSLQGKLLQGLVAHSKQELSQKYQDAWYEELLEKVPQEDRAWVEKRFVEAIRSLL